MASTTRRRKPTFRTWAFRARRRLSKAAARLSREKRVQEAADALVELARIEVTEVQSAALSAAAHLVQASRFQYRAGDTKTGARLLEVSVALTSHAMAARNQLATVGNGGSPLKSKQAQSESRRASSAAKTNTLRARPRPFTRGAGKARR